MMMIINSVQLIVVPLHIIVIESQSKTLLPVVEKRVDIFMHISLDPGH